MDFQRVLPFLLLILLFLIPLFILLRDSLSFDFNRYRLVSFRRERRGHAAQPDDGSTERAYLRDAEEAQKHHRNDPPSLEFFFFSDAHADTSRLRLHKISEILLAEPELPVFFGGDLYSKKKNAAKGLRFITRLAELRAETAELEGRRAAPIYLIRGNHDTGLSAEQLTAPGLVLLQNESIYLRGKTGEVYQVAAADDARVGEQKIDEARRCCSPYSPCPPSELPFARRILLVHNPDAVLDEASQNFAFIFSGHFHDGQIRLPFRMEFKNLREDLLPKRKIYDQFFVNGESLAYISSGIGTVLFPLRFRTRAELCRFSLIDATEEKDSTQG